MRLVKIIQKEKSTIEVYSNDISQNEQYKNLSLVYNLILKISNNRKNKGEFTNFFYSEKELKLLGKSDEYTFIDNKNNQQ